MQIEREAMISNFATEADASDPLTNKESMSHVEFSGNIPRKLLPAQYSATYSVPANGRPMHPSSLPPVVATQRKYKQGKFISKDTQNDQSTFIESTNRFWKPTHQKKTDYAVALPSTTTANASLIPRQLQRTMATKEDYFNESIDDRHPLRIGTQMLPTLPVETIWADGFPDSTYDGEYQELSPDNLLMIHRILDECRVENIRINLEFRVRQGTPIVDGQLPTITIVSDIEKGGGRNAWILAARTIRAELRDQGLPLSIEILDHTAFQDTIITRPILSQERDLIKKFQSLLPEILNRVEDHDWRTLDFLHRGPREYRCRPTLVIGAKDPDDEKWWNQTLPTLRSLLSPGVDVELRFVDDILAVITAKKDRWHDKRAIVGGPFVTMDDYEELIGMGSSCGVDGKDWSGTIGGMVQLSQGSETITCAITNHHVLWDDGDFDNGRYRPLYDLIAANACEERDSHRWVDPKHISVTTERQQIVSPSDQDHIDMVARLESRITECQEMMASRKRITKALYDKAEGATLRRAKRDETQAKINKQTAEEFDRKIGNVFASSGRRVEKHTRYDDAEIQGWSVYCPEQESSPTLPPHVTLEWLLDWGLVKITAERFMKTDIPETVPNVWLKRGNQADTYCNIDPFQNYDVAKVGRTSRWTPGKISAVPSVINWPSEYQQRRPSVATVSIGGRIGLCHTIVNEENEARMIEKGDSGCLVLLDQDTEKGMDGKALIVGLGFGHASHRLVSYMIPFDLVVEDIERVTKMKVQIPYYGGLAAGSESRK